jgi:hypothetical protein
MKSPLEFANVFIHRDAVDKYLSKRRRRFQERPRIK